MAVSSSTATVNEQPGPFGSVAAGYGPVQVSESVSSSGSTSTAIAGVGLLARRGGKAGAGYDNLKTFPLNKRFEGIPVGKLKKAGSGGEVGYTWVPYSVNCLSVALTSIIDYATSDH